jgi:hypothetical protein
MPVFVWAQAAPQGAGSGNTTPASPSTSSKVPAKPPQPQTDQTTNIPYFTLRDGMASTLTLNNLAPAPTDVTVTLFNTEGRAQVLDPIAIDPHSFKQIELREVVKSELFDSGNIEVAFHGIPMAVTCQVSVYSVDKRVSFQSREQDMMDFASWDLNGILWLPQGGAEGFLALTNVSKNKVTIQLTVGTKKKEIALYSRETRLLKLNGDLDEDERRSERTRGQDESFRSASTSSLIKLQHNGLPGDVITQGFVLNLETGYSSSFTMADPKMMRSSHLAGAHIRFGQPDPSEGFPAGTTFTSPLLLANVSDKPVPAHVSVDYTVAEKLAMTPIDPKHGDTQDKFSNVAVKDLTIAPGNVQRIELAEELAKLGVSTPVKEAGVDIDYQGAPGSLIGQLVSVDQTGDYSFEVPIKDPMDDATALESVYPWTIENDIDTVLHLKNTTGQSQRAAALLKFPDDETYNLLEPVTLEPYQTLAIDLQKAKESNKPDSLGRSFPRNATHGLLFWHNETPYSMIGRAEQVNIKSGIASSFSCGDGCCDYWTQNGYWLNPSSLTGYAGGSGSFQGMESYYDCFGALYQNWVTYPTQWQNWRTTDSSVATASAGNSYTDSGNVSYIDAGTATINADFYDHDWEYNCYFHCVDNYRYYGTVAAQVTVSCGDANEDALIQEYRTYPTDPNSPFIPPCNIFSQFTQSLYFQASELRNGDNYTWALIRVPLTVDHTLGYGLDLWRANYGTSRIINSGYRNPAHNASVPGSAMNSQHVFGTAGDLRNESGGTTEYNNMVTAARNANADFIEQPSGPCGMACVHADWRSHDIGQYALDQ